jgi:2-polyprenyl-3-methyl-5-hydroxy-6-metoxy-1,4-benzoquinol methylase
MLTKFQYRILKTMFPGRDSGAESVYDRQSKLSVLMGPEFFARIAGKTVIDFGCGEGVEAVEMARRGAGRVIGIDVREEVLETARERAVRAGVEDTCLFTLSTREPADVVVSIDAFEHFESPEEILRIMNTLLKPDGEVLVSFGPTWYHPFGGHLFSVFPWAHLIFGEEALIRWRSGFKKDGARRFGEVAGGLNQMTIAHFEKLVADSPLRFADFEAAPIHKVRHFHNRVTREFTTAVVRCRLVKRI